MSHEVHWTEKITQSFIQKAMLSDDEIYVLTSRIKGTTISQQAIHLHKSEITVHRMISKLKKKYDVVQAEFPDDFPKRRNSKEEEYMDTH